MINYFLRILILSILFSGYTTPTQELTDHEKIGIAAAIFAASSISLYVAYEFKNDIFTYLMNIYRKIYSKNDSSDKDNFHHHDEKKTIQDSPENKFSPEEIEKQLKLTKESTELHKACENDDINQVKVILENKEICINAKRDHHPNGDIWGETALHIACEKGNEKIVRLLLLAEDIDPGIPNKNCHTPFEIACRKGYLEIVKLFADKLVNAKKHEMYYALRQNKSLCSAYKNQHLTIVYWLLEQNYFSIDISSFIALVYEKKDQNTLDYLLNEKNFEKYSDILMSVACQQGYIDMVTLLLEKKNYSITKECSADPLIVACTHNQTEIVRLLLNKNIDINVRTKNQETVFHLAANNYEILQLLLAKDTSLINEKHTGTMGYECG